MADEIDQQYLDENFVSRINSLDDESLKTIIESVLSNYKTEYTFDEIEAFSKEINKISSSANPINVNHFIRQLKYLINKGIYGRITKKFKNDLLALGIELNKIELLAEMQKAYHDINLAKNEEQSNKENFQVKSFDMFTEMPICNSDYRIIEDDKKNEDVKKQNLFLNFTLTEDDNEENCVMQISKDKLVGMFSQIEKIQEHLDQLS